MARVKLTLGASCPLRPQLTLNEGVRAVAILGYHSPTATEAASSGVARPTPGMLALTVLQAHQAFAWTVLLSYPSPRPPSNILMQEEVFQQKLERAKEASDMDMKESVPGSRHSSCKGPGAGLWCAGETVSPVWLEQGE